MRVLGILCLLVAPAWGQVVINEVLFRPLAGSPDANRNHQWVELFNKGAEPVDLTGWKMSGRDGRTGAMSRDLPPLSLPAGGYLVIHFAEGEDRLEFGEDGAHYYTKDPPGTLVWNPNMDEAALYSSDAIVDFLCWGSEARRYEPGQAHKDAIDARIWSVEAALSVDWIAASSLEPARTVREGTSAGRDFVSTDRNLVDDFDSDGGANALNITPGRVNSDDPDRFVSASTPPAEAAQAAGSARRQPAATPKKWTILLYFNTDNNLSKWAFLSLEAYARAGGSNEDVNFVAMYDSLGISMDKKTVIWNKTYRGLVVQSPPYLQALPGESTDIGERNLSDPATLKEFIEWAKANYPAERYAIGFMGHGGGWKSFGPDESSPGAFDDDNLFMGEFSAGLAGQTFEVIWFDSCLMAGLEVAYQLRSFAKYMVASEESILVASFVRPELVEALRAAPSMDGERLARSLTDIIAAWHRTGALYDWTIAAIDLRQVDSLARQVNRWALDMIEALPVFQKRDDPLDNVQVLIRVAWFNAYHFLDENFTDLYSLADQIERQPLPSCVKRAIPEIKRLITNIVVVSNQSRTTGQSRGVHIYFPFYRTRRDRIDVFRLGARRQSSVDPYDHPWSRHTDGSSRRATYARGYDALPLDALDQDKDNPAAAVAARSQPALRAPEEWPSIASQGFQFPVDTAWGEFLSRYYHPVADALIVDAMGLGIKPVSIGGGECSNPVDYIRVPVGATVNLSGSGSSDADQPRVVKPLRHYWDLDDQKECDPGTNRQQCKAPYEVDRADAADNSGDNMDADRFFRDTTIDDRDADGEKAQRKCEEARQYVVTLIPWDEDHTYRWHDTNPTGRFVHPQSGRHQAIIDCIALPTMTGVFVAPPFVQTGDAVLLTFVVAVSAAARAIGLPVDVLLTNLFNGAWLAESDDAATPEPPRPSSTNQAADQRLFAGTLPEGVKTTVVTAERGEIVVRAVAGNPGRGSFRFETPGVATVEIPVTIQARLAEAPDEIVLSPPGNVRVGQAANLIVIARKSGRVLQDVVFTFYAPEATAQFANGTRFRNSLGMQARTDATGRTFAAVQALVNGPIRIQVAAGPIVREITLTATGGPELGPTRIRIVSSPPFVRAGQEAELRYQVLSASAVVPGRPVRFVLDSGVASITGTSDGTKEVTVNTNDRGEAFIRFRPAEAGQLRIIGSVPGTNLSFPVTIPVLAP